MRTDQILTTFLLSVLSLQIICIDPTPFVSDQHYGSIAEASPMLTHDRPITVSSARFAFARRDPDSIIFVGDVLLARNVEYLMRQKGVDHPFRGVDFRELADDPYVVANFESSIPSEHRPTNAGEMVFSVDERFLPTLASVGFTHVSLANNHSLDHGDRAYLNTVERLSEQDLNPFGHPKLLDEDSITYLHSEGSVVALIGLHAVASSPSESTLRKVLGLASKQSDLQVVFVHWGEEYELNSSRTQQSLAKKLVAAGADLIIGHHPHVVQEVGLIDGVPVFYSLGNYIFDQYFSRDTQEGLLVQFDLSSEPTLHLIPVSSADTLSSPQLMDPRRHAEFLNELAERSDSDLAAHITAGIIPLDSLVASSPKMAMIKP